MEKSTEKKNNFKVAFDEIIKGKVNTSSNNLKEEKSSEKFEEIEPILPVADKAVNNLEINFKHNSNSDSTIISEETIIEGSIKTKANLIIRGDINGDVESEKDIEIIGNVVGNVKGNSTIFLKGSINGNVSGHILLTLIKESKVTGDINGQELECDGSVTGNVNASNSVYLGPNSIVKGNIISKSITVKEGAQIKGSMEIL
ncbi:cytoskeletal protein CcmA (bactofilin family) [Sedimentibacter acidaminivorans]|uniref:Cytoskeletal protein CcmA (Bactofilin family) n=1 Tax=Sedimentibacter acidaminivorans TaxID=913099 RepID=A0ABS4GH33_9FIRM|nr:polymer-forming cytoskeletal protein [Sedimentibacter acidaminivorans]MBP1926986.1 cytoskeletal protein CcmA (bactofilin family) [Sedimentibacter acidaminivorans]